MITAKLTERLELQVESLTGNTTGEGVPVYQTFQIVYASITNQKGDVRFASDSPNYYDNISFYLRYQPDLPKKGLGVLYQNEFYKVLNITTVQRNQAMILDCQKVF